MAGPRHARMHDALAWLQSSALGMVMRGSGPWTYPVVNLIHILGVAALFGAVLILDLRLLGVWRRAPLPSIATVPPRGDGRFRARRSQRRLPSRGQCSRVRAQPVSAGEVRGNRTGTRERRRAGPHCGVEGGRHPRSVPLRGAAAGAHGWRVARQLADGGRGRADDRVLVVNVGGI